MNSKAKGTGLVGYNVQVAVDAKHHLIVAHEVTNVGNDRAQLHKMAEAAREAMGKGKLHALADRGYFNGTELKACEDAGITTYVPKPMTSGAKAEGRFDKSDFVYIAQRDEYRCLAGEHAIHRFTTVEQNGLTAHIYWTSACPQCPIKNQCTPSSYRRIRRWEHEDVLERVQQRLDRKLDALTVRRRTVEHVFGTLKHWTGTTHFLTKTHGACGHRDEPAGAGIQPQAGAADSGNREEDEGDAAGGGVSPSHAVLPMSKTSARPNPSHSEEIGLRDGLGGPSDH